MVVSEGYYGFLQGWQHRRHKEVNLSSIPDLQGKVALVTGANAGIGKVATHVLASRGAKVYMACRSRPKAEAAMREMRRETPTVNLHFLSYDASSLSGAHSAGLTFLAQEPLPLDILILNAGIILDEPVPTKDGLESIYATNHLAHFALTMALLPALEKAAGKENGDVRVTATASAGFGLHPDAQSLHVSEPEIVVGSERFWWEGDMPMYGRSKTCNILFMKELSRSLREKTAWGEKVRCNAVHPGTVSTSLNDKLKKGWYVYVLERMVYALASIPSSAGAVNMLYTSTSREIREKDISAKYLTPYGYVNSAPDQKPAGDPELAKTLWEESIKVCGKYIEGFEGPGWGK